MCNQSHRATPHSINLELRAPEDKLAIVTMSREADRISVHYELCNLDRSLAQEAIIIPWSIANAREFRAALILSRYAVIHRIDLGLVILDCTVAGGDVTMSFGPTAEAIISSHSVDQIVDWIETVTN